MGRRRTGRGVGLAAVVAIVLAVAAALPGGARADSPVDVNWTAYLPAMATPPGHAGGPVAHCRKARMRCVDRVVRRLRHLRRDLGCDHRGVFATTYLTLTKVLRRTLRTERGFFADRRALIFEDVLFADVYLRTLRRAARGREVDPAWRIALDAAAAGDLTGTGDMLLGINAHVQNDMPFVLAALTLRDRRGNSRKADHDQGNLVLDRAFGPVVEAVARRYDPMTDLHTTQISPASDIFGIELVRSWREGVWRNAERLTLARDEAERRQVAESIHAQAATSALAIQATLQGPPGHRAARDAYCSGRR